MTPFIFCGCGNVILKNICFISGTDRDYNINLNYLGEAVIEGNTSNVKLAVDKGGENKKVR